MILPPNVTNYLTRFPMDLSTEMLIVILSITNHHRAERRSQGKTPVFLGMRKCMIGNGIYSTNPMKSFHQKNQERKNKPHS